MRCDPIIVDADLLRIWKELHVIRDEGQDGPRVQQINQMKSIDYGNMPSQWRGMFGDDIESPTNFSKKPALERMTNYEKEVAEKALNNHSCTLPRNYYNEDVSIGFQS